MIASISASSALLGEARCTARRGVRVIVHIDVSPTSFLIIRGVAEFCELQPGAIVLNF